LFSIINVRLSIIEHAEFNLPLEAEELAVSVPEGTRIVDKRIADRTRVGLSGTAGDPVVLADELAAGQGRSRAKPQPRGVAPLRFWLSLTALLLGGGLASVGLRRLLMSKT
jgi:hypothetical protein